MTASVHPVESKGLVLVVEDDRAIADLVCLYLRRDGFGTHVETDGPGALDAVRRLRPVAVVLDIGLPGSDGIEVCRSLRAGGDWTPVLFVTARDDEVDRVLGLELGADDNEVTLTSTEFDLLAHLMRRPGQVFERSQLLSAVWGYSAAAGTRTVDVHIAQLRGKLGIASPIRTVRGVGYSADAS